MAQPSSSSSSRISDAHVHVVEIPVDSETSQQQQQQEQDQQALMVAHPLSEISESPGHLLLLKLFNRQEDQIAHQIGLKESRLDGLKRSAFFLSSLFFAFHALFLTLLYTSSVAADDARACRNWWIPCCLSLLTSAVLVLSVQLNVWSYWRALVGLQRDRSDARALTRCVQELRMKGSSFDLSKEPQVSRRMKSSSVEIKWRPLRWLKRYVVSICLVAVAGLVAPASKFILCY